jgi:O-antigen/teichoic acid export membrane protein
MFNALHMSMETLYLKLFHGDAAAGIFTAATRLMTPLAVFPTIIAISAAPLIAKASASDQRQPQERQPQDAQDIRQEYVSGDMSKLFSLGFKTLLVGSVMITGFGVTNTRWLLEVVLGAEFRESAVPMMLLFLTFIPMALNIFLVEVNNARDRLKTNTRFAAVLALTSILLGAMLTWQWSADGAAVAKVVAVSLGLGYLIMRSREGIAFAVRPLVWKSVLLFVLLVGLREALDPINRWVANGAALAAVTAGIFLLRVYTTEELRQWRRQFAALLSRPG